MIDRNIIFILILMLSFSAFAQNVDSAEAIKISVLNLLCDLYHFIIVVAGAVTALVLIFAGVRFITSGGASDTAGAKRMVVYAFFGLLLIMIACPLIDFVLTNTRFVSFEGSCSCYTLEKNITSSTFSTTSTSTTTLPDVTFPSTTSTTTTTTSTSSTSTTTTTLLEVLIAAIRQNMETDYSAAEIASIENKTGEYQDALARDGLGSLFLYLDSDNTSDLIGSKVTNPGNWNDVDAVLDQVVTKFGIKYVLILGGYDRFPVATAGGYYTDNHYSDSDGDGLPDVALGRLPDPNDGDVALILRALDTFISLHDSGGVDLSDHLGRTLDYTFYTMCWTDYIWSSRCEPYPLCSQGTSDSKTAASGKDFFFLVQHGTAGPPQKYEDTFTPPSLGSMSLDGAVWMIVPCYGGVIDYASTSDSIVLTFFKNGGAVHMGSTTMNCCASVGMSCSTNLDEGIGALYYWIAKNFYVGGRIGDAYMNGKLGMKSNLGNGYGGEFYINCLYGDPTLKIKSKW